MKFPDCHEDIKQQFENAATMSPPEQVVIKLSLFPRSSKKLQRQLSVSAVPNFRNATITHKKLGSFMGGDRVYATQARQTVIPDPLRSDVAEAREAVLGIKSQPVTPAANRKGLNSPFSTPTHAKPRRIDTDVPSSSAGMDGSLTPLRLSLSQVKKVADESLSSSRDEISSHGSSQSDEEYNKEDKRRSQSFSAGDMSSLSSSRRHILENRDRSGSVVEERSSSLTSSKSPSSHSLSPSPAGDFSSLSSPSNDASSGKMKKKKKSSAALLSPTSERKVKKSKTHTEPATAPISRKEKKEKEKEKDKDKELHKLEKEREKEKEKEREREKRKLKKMSKTASTSSITASVSPERHRKLLEKASSSATDSTSHVPEEKEAKPKSQEILSPKRKKASSVIDAGSRTPSEIDSSSSLTLVTSTSYDHESGFNANSSGALQSAPSSTQSVGNHSPTSPTLKANRIVRKETSTNSASSNEDSAYANASIETSSTSSHLSTQVQVSPRSKRHHHFYQQQNSSSSSSATTHVASSPPENNRSPPGSLLTNRSRKGSRESNDGNARPNLGNLADLKEMLGEVTTDSVRKERAASRENASLTASPSRGALVGTSPSRARVSKSNLPAIPSGTTASHQAQPPPSNNSTSPASSLGSGGALPPIIFHSANSSSPGSSRTSSPLNPNVLSRSIDVLSPGRLQVRGGGSDSVVHPNLESPSNFGSGSSNFGKNAHLGTIHGGVSSVSSDDNPLSYHDEATAGEDSEDEVPEVIANLRLSEDDIYSTMRRNSRMLINTRNRSNSLLLQDLFASPSAMSRSKFTVGNGTSIGNNSVYGSSGPSDSPSSSSFASTSNPGQIPVRYEQSGSESLPNATSSSPGLARGSSQELSRPSRAVIDFNNTADDSIIAERAAELTRSSGRISARTPSSSPRVPYSEMRSGSFSIDSSTRNAVNHRDRMMLMVGSSSKENEDASMGEILSSDLRMHASRLPIGSRGSLRSSSMPLMRQCRGFWVEVGREAVTPSMVLAPGSLSIDGAADEKLWYAEYFASHAHFNYIGTANGSPSQPENFVLSVIRPPGANMMRVLLRTKRGDERQMVGESKETAKIFKAKIPASDLMRLIAPTLTNVKMRHVKDLNLIYDLMAYEERLRTTTYKFGVLLCKEGQTKEEEMFSNEYGSEQYEAFLNMLGETVELKGWERFKGGLDATERQATGTHSVYATFEGNEIMFHVSTLLPFSTDNPQQLERKRHLGNDIVVLVFKEGNTPFLPNTISSEFIHVLAVVQPEIQNERVKYRFSIASKDGVPPFSPPLPASGLFEPGVAFRNLILTKLINGERAAYKAPAFTGKFQRTRQIMLKELDTKFK